MTLQQLEYIVAVDKHRHFVRAAESCGVTQSTLSSMIQKLETELDVVIFDRMSHPIKPTALGEEIIGQARVILYNARQMGELVDSHKQRSVGRINIGIASTIAPYLLPKLFREIGVSHPDVSLHVEEARVATILSKLRRAEIDVAILAAPAAEEDMLEIPIMRERYVAYVSEDDELYKQSEIDTRSLTAERIWLLGESYCPNSGQFPFCINDVPNATTYVAGTIETLIRIVDENGGYTIIPEQHLEFLGDEARKKIRPLVNPEPGREIAFVVRKDFVRERMLNILAEAIKRVVDEDMLDERLKRFRIKL